MLYRLLLLFVCCNSMLTTFSQIFSKGEQFTILPSQILIENYTPVTLAPEVINDEKANQFMPDKTDTQLQVIIDNNGNRYHILSQTNFPGKIIFLAISNNLALLFNKREKPFFVFNQCIKQLNDFFSPQQNVDAAIKCIMDRLELCSSN